jgi:integrase
VTTPEPVEYEVLPMAKSTTSRSTNKPKFKKPYEGFPLTAHPSGRWCKKHRGKAYYFGKLDDWEAALERYKNEWPYILKGRTPPSADDGDGCTIKHLANKFLTSKKNKMEAGELSPRSFQDYYTTCEMLIDALGKDRHVDDLRPDDFERLRKQLAKRLGPVTLRNEINRCRVVFKFAHDQRLTKESIHYGQSFNRPSAKDLRRARNEAGPRLFEADEIRRILDAADPVMKSMVLLGVNCGFGNSDLSSLPQSAVGLDAGWIDFPRPKTEIPRRVPLWPETVKALREAIALRPEPADSADADLCFLTVRGLRLVRTTPGKKNPGRFTVINWLAPKFGGLLKKLGINGRRGLNFYALRHTFETIAGESRDQVAVNAIMGHVDSSMAATYRERISDERLRAVVDVVRSWLFETGN